MRVCPKGNRTFLTLVNLLGVGVVGVGLGAGVLVYVVLGQSGCFHSLSLYAASVLTPIKKLWAQLGASGRALRGDWGERQGISHTTPSGLFS